VILVRDGEFNGGGTSDLHISDVCLLVLTCWEPDSCSIVVWLSGVSASSPAYSLVLPTRRKPVALSSRTAGPFGRSEGSLIPHDLRPEAPPRNC